MVHPILAAFGSGIRRKIKHIPYMSRPDKRPGKELLDQLLMVICLIFFRIVSLLRIGGMPVESLASILAHSNWDIGILCVKMIKKFSVHGGIAAIPPIIVIIRDYVRYLQISRIYTTHGYNRYGG